MNTEKVASLMAKPALNVSTEAYRLLLIEYLGEILETVRKQRPDHEWELALLACGCPTLFGLPIGSTTDRLEIESHMMEFIICTKHTDLVSQQ